MRWVRWPNWNYPNIKKLYIDGDPNSCVEKTQSGFENVHRGFKYGMWNEKKECFAQANEKREKTQYDFENVNT